VKCLAAALFVVLVLRLGVLRDRGAIAAPGAGSDASGRA